MCKHPVLFMPLEFRGDVVLCNDIDFFITYTEVESEQFPTLILSNGSFYRLINRKYYSNIKLWYCHFSIEENLTWDDVLCMNIKYVLVH